MFIIFTYRLSPSWIMLEWFHLILLGFELFISGIKIGLELCRKASWHLGFATSVNFLEYVSEKEKRKTQRETETKRSIFVLIF